MKKAVSLFVALLMIMMVFTNVCASGSFDESEHDMAISLQGSEWKSCIFDSDLLIKIDVSSDNTVSVLEMVADAQGDLVNYSVYTKGYYSYKTQNFQNSMPAYTAIPHNSDLKACYLKVKYDDYNSWLHGHTIRIRIREVSSNIYGWQNAERMGLNEEHSIKFSSMNDSKWFKLVVPDDTFRYTYDITSSKQGCFVGSIYKEEDLQAGNTDAYFCDCVQLKASKITVDTQMGAGTYYIQLSPISLYDDILNTKFLFSTDNKNSNEVVETYFGAEISAWAKDEVEKAYGNGLIPKKIANGDLTKKVSREEFAAIAVELYEKLSNKTVGSSNYCSFEDIDDSDFRDEIKKAYTISAVEGISQTLYAPRSFINREQLATILCRVLKKDMEDKNIPFKYVNSYNVFADDMYISDWAKPSVYFMANQGLIKGISDTMFAPKNVTTEQEALGYASATKEQAIIIAQRIFSN